MLNAPRDHNNNHARHQDSHRDGTGAHQLWLDSQHPSQSHDRPASQEPRRQIGHRTPLQSVPPHRFGQTGSEQRHRSRTLHSNIQSRFDSDDPQSCNKFLNFGSAQYSDYYPKDRFFGSRPDMAGYHGHQDGHRQRHWSEEMDGMLVHPDRRPDIDAYAEPRSHASQPRDHHNSPYTHAPPRRPADEYTFAEGNGGYVAENEPRGTRYPQETIGHPSFHDATRRSVTRETEPIHGRLLPKTSQDPDLGRELFPEASASRKSQAFWGLTPAPPRYHQMQFRHSGLPPLYQQIRNGRTGPPLPYQRAHDSLGRLPETSTYEVEHSMMKEYHHSAYDEAHENACDPVSFDDERMTRISRHNSKSGTAFRLSYVDEEEKKTKAWDFAVESFKKGEIEALVDCGSPYLEQAARKLLQQVESNQASSDSTPRFKSKTTSKPIPPRKICPFVESDAEKEVTGPRNKGAHRELEHDHTPAADSCLLTPANSSSGAAQSKLLRDRARQDSPRRPQTTARDTDLASLFEESGSTVDCASLSVQEIVTPEKELVLPQAVPASGEHANDHGQAVRNALAQNDQPQPTSDFRAKSTTNSDDDPFSPAASALASQTVLTSVPNINRSDMVRILAERNRQKELPNSSTPQPVQRSQPISQVAVTPSPKINRAEMARLSAERNRQKQISSMLIPPEPGAKMQSTIPQPVKMARHLVTDTGSSRHRAISVSSAENENEYTSSDSSSDKDEQDNRKKDDGAQDLERQDKKGPLLRALKLLRGGAFSSSSKGDDSGGSRGPGPAEIFSTRPPAPSKKPDQLAPRKGGAAPAQHSGWQAASAMIQKIPAAPEIKKPAAVGTSASSLKDPQNGHDKRGGQDSKEKRRPGDKKKEQSTSLDNTEEHIKEMESVEESIGDIMKYRAEMERIAQKKREAEEEMSRQAEAESKSDLEEEREEPQPHNGSRPFIKPPRKALTQRRKSVVARERLRQVAPVTQLSDKSVPIEDDDEADDECAKAKPVARPRKRPPGSKSQSAQLGKRKITEPVMSSAKKCKASLEQGSTAGPASTTQDNKHGLPPLQSPIASPNLKACVDSFGGDIDAFKAAVPTCAKLMSQERDVVDVGGLASKRTRPPAFQRRTSLPKPIITSQLRAARKKPLPEVVHEPIIEEVEKNDIAARSTKKSPQVTRKTLKQALVVPNASTIMLPKYEGVLITNPNLETPPNNRGANNLALGEADKWVVKWRNMGLKWSHIRTLFINDTGHILHENTLHSRYKRALEAWPELAETAIKSTTAPLPADAPVPQTQEERQAEKSQAGCGGKSWNLDALEAWHANQREIAAFLTDGEADEDDEKMSNVVVDRQVALHSRREMHMHSPEPLNENECWYQYQVLRKVWKKKTPTRTFDPGNADAHEDSDSDTSDDGEQDSIEILVPETVVGRSYYHTLHEANAAAGQEMRGERFGASGIGPTGVTGCLLFKYEAGPHGMTNQEARFADDVVVRVWVDRFVRAPGMARQDELQLEDDPQRRKPDVRSAPHGWQAKLLWVVKRKEVEVLQTRKVREPHVDGEEGVVEHDADNDAMNTEETKLLDIKDLGAYTVLDAANRNAAELALEYEHPSTNKRIDAIQVRCERQKQFEEMVKDCEERETPFVAEFEGYPVVLADYGESDGVRRTNRVDTTFWVESSMLQGPRNI